MTDKIVFWIAMAVGLPVLAWKVGYDNAMSEKWLTCPAYQGEKLAYTTQTAIGVTCTYVAHTTGLAKKTRRI